jgi:hypothetical protein
MVPKFLTRGCFFKKSLTGKCCLELAALVEAHNSNSWLHVTYQWWCRFFLGGGEGGGGCIHDNDDSQENKMIKILFCAGNGEVIEYSLNMSIELRIYCKQFSWHLEEKIIENQMD